MQESSIIQYFTEKGVEQGIEQDKKQHAVEAILTVLEGRFQTDVAEKLKPFLGVIDDLERLDQFIVPLHAHQTLMSLRRPS